MFEVEGPLEREVCEEVDFVTAEFTRTRHSNPVDGHRYLSTIASMFGAESLLAGATRDAYRFAWKAVAHDRRAAELRTIPRVQTRAGSRGNTL